MKVIIGQTTNPVQLGNVQCGLCQEGVESAQHLFITYKVT